MAFHGSELKDWAEADKARLTGVMADLKQLDNLNDEKVVLNWKRNYQDEAFCGLIAANAK